MVSMSPASIASKKRCAMSRMSFCSAMSLSLNLGAEHAAAVRRDQPVDVVALIGGIGRGTEGRQHVLRPQLGHFFPFGLGADPIVARFDPLPQPPPEPSRPPPPRPHAPQAR